MSVHKDINQKKRLHRDKQRRHRDTLRNFKITNRNVQFIDRHELHELTLINMQHKAIFSTVGNVRKSLMLMIPMIILNLFFITRGDPNTFKGTNLISLLITFIFFCYLFFMMLYTGKTDRFRAAGFISFALFFTLVFIAQLIQVRGERTFSNETWLSCQIPFCHIVTTMVIIPIVFTKSIIFPGSILTGFASISSMLVIVLGVNLALGRGFCSWGCFYGGWDDMMSRFMKKPLIKNVNPAFKWFPFAVLILVAVSSAILLSPTYCDWLCPFKTTTEYEKITSPTTVIKTIIFLTLFISLVLVLPLLTRKRIQCSTLCPMGALSSFANKINVFDVKIDKEKCNNCYLCTKACPTLSLDKGDVDRGKASMTCTKCGKCIDTCTRNAINYQIKGTTVNTHINTKRMLFLYASYMLLVIFSGYTMMTGINMIIKLMTTGRII